jgi:death-on-curing protein
MSEGTHYLSVDRVILLHQRIMVKMGSEAAPLRSFALLESAVLRPQHLAYYEDADLAEQAAILAIGISQNQPFLDGNKRTAFVSMRAFLRINGYRVDAMPLDIAHQLVGVAERSKDRDQASAEFATWLRERLKSIGGTQ